MLGNATTIDGLSKVPLPTSLGCRVESRLSNTVEKVAGSPAKMYGPMSESRENNAGVNAEIPPPVMDRITDAFLPEFSDQADVDKRWTALKEYLSSATLQEQEILDVLKSGILQTDTGKAISGLFESAIVRSIRRSGTLGEARLKKIVDALCHLPPGQWQSALGEQARFSSDQSAGGVMGFIQSRLDVSSAERDQKIAYKQWVSNVQWDAIKEITLDVGQYVRSSNRALFSAWQILKDDCELRPSLKDAQAHLAEVIVALRDPLLSERKRWNDHLIDKVEAVNDQLKPDYQRASAGPEKSRPDELISLKFFNTPKPSGNPLPTLLENLQGFERHANFYTNVNTAGPGIPEKLFAKFLYVCNAMDTVGVLKLDRSHISTVQPDPTPSDYAWKNGASDFSRSPLEPGPEQSQPAAHIDPLASLEQFFAQTDELLNEIARKVVPWDSAHADEQREAETMLESVQSQVYRSTTMDLTDQPSDSQRHYLAGMKVVGEQLSGWLARMSGSLLSTGVAVLGRTGDLIEQHPGKAAGVFAGYMAISNFYANWFLPEPEQAFDPLQGLELYSDAAPDEHSVAHEYIVEGLEDLFEVFPEFASEVKRLISESDYADPADDPQLIENIEVLSQLFVPGHKNVTYQDYLHEITVLAALDAHDEFEADPDSGST
jgi:hypothetical protein